MIAMLDVWFVRIKAALAFDTSKQGLGRNEAVGKHQTNANI